MTRTADDDQPGRPFLRVVRGDATPEEIAALVAVLLAAGTKGNPAVTADWTYVFATVDPPATAHGAKAEVIGASGGPTYGHGY